MADQVSSSEGHLVAATLPTEATPAAQASSHPADPDQPPVIVVFILQNTFKIFDRNKVGHTVTLI